MLSSPPFPAITASSSIDSIVASVCFTRRMDAVDPLIRRAQDGDQTAFRELFLRHRNDVARVVFRVLGPSPDVDDVTQDVFIHVYRSLKSFRGDSKFSTWLYRLTINVARMHLRKGRSRPQISDTQVPEAPRAGEELDGPDESLARNQRVKALYRLVEGLSEKKRAVLVLHDLEGVPAKQIAEIVEAPVLTVRTRLFYARKELYAAIAKDAALAPLLEDFKGLLSGNASENDSQDDSQKETP